MRANNLKQLWAAGHTATNAWLTIGNSWTAEIMANAGFDAITVDMQHGMADFQTTVTMLQAISTRESMPLVRVPWNDPMILMRVLDAGAYGIVCPMISTRAEAEAFVGACRYPPEGWRSFGPIRANVYAGDDYFAHANETILTFAMIETQQGLDNIEAIITTSGLDGVYIGTVDLSISMGLAGMGDLDDPALQKAINKILALATQHKRFVGIHARTPDEVAPLSKMGFHLITLVNDTKLLKSAAKDALKQAQQYLPERDETA